MAERHNQLGLSFSIVRILRHIRYSLIAVAMVATCLLTGQLQAFAVQGQAAIAQNSNADEGDGPMEEGETDGRMMMFCWYSDADMIGQRSGIPVPHQIVADAGDLYIDGQRTEFTDLNLTLDDGSGLVAFMNVSLTHLTGTVEDDPRAAYLTDEEKQDLRLFKGMQQGLLTGGKDRRMLVDWDSHSIRFGYATTESRIQFTHRAFCKF